MFEYKVVPAPVRAVRVKGLKTTAERFAHTVAESINAEAAGGWQFVRTETMPCETRSALGATKQTQQVVMIFAREVGARRPDAGAALAAVQAAPAVPAPAPAPVRAAPQPVADPEPQPVAEAPRVQPEPQVAQAPAEEEPAAPVRRREPLFRSGAMLRSEGAVRNEPVLRPRAAPDETENGEDGER
ncbi:DUF4177 domain-containing protein [Rhodobacter sp. NTK016B]|uniref:DUF4177 domain-containing protein n=1 Tax=Rhodobacter sp. NTK016B TaxID=2759676 RepID=UPI001A8D3F41|nr:DUF4177 domain-containing protein [Rhodobacter sp. NTK016B]MBN8291584.1 DUF4177 domain-containing protein [Rhodobacter sp. NTK016B]